MKECSILFVLHIETSNLIWTENQMTSFYMQCYNGLKWDNVLENSPQNAFSFHCLNKTKGITPLHSKTSTKKTIHRYNSNNHIKKVLWNELFVNLTWKCCKRKFQFWEVKWIKYSVERLYTSISIVILAHHRKNK